MRDVTLLVVSRLPSTGMGLRNGREKISKPYRIEAMPTFLVVREARQKIKSNPITMW
jgi:hypothetical protein